MSKLTSVDREAAKMYEYPQAKDENLCSIDREARRFYSECYNGSQDIKPGEAISQTNDLDIKSVTANVKSPVKKFNASYNITQETLVEKLSPKGLYLRAITARLKNQVEKLNTRGSHKTFKSN